MTQVLKSHVCGKWVEGQGERQKLYNPTTEEVIAEAGTNGVDFAACLEYGRNHGGPALRELNFAQRGELLMAMSKAIYEFREELLDLSTQNGGNTRGDAKFDIDGATGTLSYYAKLSEKLGDARLLTDGKSAQLGRSPRLIGRHVYGPRTGVAVHINAFNFPGWGFAEKAAVSILAGMPVVTKPATSAALVAARIAEILVDSKVLPDGAMQFLCGSVGDLIDHLDWQDVVAFTGSSDTGLKIRSHRNVLEKSVRVNIEADSLNGAIIGPDIDRDADAYDLFMREVVRDMTQKAGQKCTAIRRPFVPQEILDDVRQDLIDQIGATKVGNPTTKGVRMGPLATGNQIEDVRAGVERLKGAAKAILGDGGRGELVDVAEGKGYFMAPVLFEAEDAGADTIHDREVFGPVSTLMTYDGSAQQVCELVKKGRGGLVTSVYSDDAKFLTSMVEGIGPFHGRLHLGSSKIAEHSPGPGTVLPMLNHGGPGRAGNGEELGATRGMAFYMQRTAVQGYSPILDKLPTTAIE
jgi:oxepin-CoA hydrolase/3-oxo-5,6-dehydrosuberyl-CoA semialdehyde dehydrogenase